MASAPLASSLAGTGTLVRLTLRRDRVLMPIWVLWLGLIPVIQAVTTRGLFTTPAEYEVYARTLNTPALRALYGPTFSPSLGGVTVGRAGFAPIVIGLISLLTVIRHTRTEEEAGRRELVGAAVVGRHAPLAAALIGAFGANVMLGLLLATGMIVLGEPTAGSAAFGGAYLAVGLMFAAGGAVAAQTSQAAGAARALGIGALGAAFVLRLVGDLSRQGTALSWLTWLSPLGWGQQLRPYADERWWVLLPAVALTAGLVSVAAGLESRRDVGAGLWPPRPGPARAAAALSSSLGLAWRLQRALLAGWTVGFAALGLVLGAASQGIRDIVVETPELADIFARMGGVEGIVDAYLATVVGLLAMVAAGYGVQSALRMRAEETAGRAEAVLAAAVPRGRWLGSHVLFALAGPATALVVGGIVLGVAHGAGSGDIAGQLPRVVAAVVVQLPAVWFVAGLAVALFGLWPGAVPGASWGALSAFAFLSLLGPVLRLEQAILDVSPFTHVPTLPGGDFSAAPLVWLVLSAVVLTVAGLGGFRRRDVPAV